MSKTKIKRQIVNAIKDSLFHQFFDDYKDSRYFSFKDLTIVLSFGEYEFLCSEVFSEKTGKC